MSRGFLVAAFAWLCLVAPWPREARAQSWFEAQVMVARDGDSADRFGYSVAANQDLALIGAPNDQLAPEPKPGRAYVFERTAGGWEERATLRARDAMPSDYFGASVALVDGLVAIGSPRAYDVYLRDALYVFSRVGSDWEQSQVLTPLESSFGGSLAGSGGTLLAGAPFELVGENEAQGVVLVYQREADQLRLVQTLQPSAPKPFDAFGAAVAIEGDTLAVGAPRIGELSASDTEAVYLFTRAAGTWTQQQELVAGEVPPAHQSFGGAVALRGDTLAVGAAQARVGTNDKQGAVYVFSRSAGSWTFAQTLTADDGKADDAFGTSVAIGPWGIAVGNGSPPDLDFPVQIQSTVYVFARSAERWELQGKLRASDGHVVDLFGTALAVAGDQLLSGSVGAAPGGRERRGAVYVHARLAEAGASCSADVDCGSAHCVGGRCCDGPCGPCGDCSSGVCTPRARGSGGEPSCAPYVCSVASPTCPGECGSHDACDAGSFCHERGCVPKREAGSACSAAHECAAGRCGPAGVCLGTSPGGAACEGDADCSTGHCSDGVCCDAECRGQCEACDLPGKTGSCDAVGGEPRGARAPCAGDLAPCRGQCDGETRDTCSYASVDQPCGSACSDAALTLRSCDGQGACVATEQRSCDNLTCADATACNTACASSDDCVSGHACQPDGSCVPSAECVNEHVARSVRGVERDCGAFRCDAQTGSCLERCASVRDCTKPNVCNNQGQCVERALPKADSCGVTGPGSGGALGVSIALWLAARRRAPRTRQRAREQQR